MKVAFIHQNFPGQYRHLAAAIADDPRNEVIAIGETKHLGRLRHPRVDEVGYPTPRGASEGTHHYVRNLEAAVRRGQAVVRTAQELKQRGFLPDIALCHPGWGDGLFLRDTWPDAKLLYFHEFFYHGRGRDMNFDPEFSSDFDDLCRTRIKNANLLLSMEVADWGMTPTKWQYASLPSAYQARTSVIFDGIETDLVRPQPSASLTLARGGTVSRSDEVITYAARNLEPYRGFHVFMRALPEILRRRPNARVVIVGGNEVSYGRRLAEDRTYKGLYLAETGDRLDGSRVHFVDKLPYDRFLTVLQVSSVHVYLTFPWVLSWSMLEAMSAGCLVVGSRTRPVEEVIANGANGLLVDFFGMTAIADAIDRVLDHPDRMEALRQAARRTVIERYDLRRHCLPAQVALVETLVAGGTPKAGPEA